MQRCSFAGERTVAVEEENLVKSQIGFTGGLGNAPYVEAVEEVLDAGFVASETLRRCHRVEPDNSSLVWFWEMRW